MAIVRNISKNNPNNMNNLDLTNYTNWLQENNFSLASINTYRKTVNKYTSKISFTTEGITQFIKKIIQRLEPATCQNYVCALASYAKWQKITNIDWNKINNLIPKTQKKFYTTINEQELALLKQARFERINWLYQRNNLVLDFLFYTGLRISELVNIKHRDYQDNTLRILGKGNKVRYVFLPDFLVKHIKFGSLGYLFPTIQGNKPHPENIRRNISRRAKLAKINKWISPHTFRRSLATNLYNRGGRLETIQKQLGHNNIQTTLGYIHNDYETLYADYSKLWKEPQISNNYGLPK